jgi:CdiI N-terminal domain
MFSISFDREPIAYPYDDPDVPGAWGQITIGSYREGFLSTLAEWDKGAYRDQWLASLKAIANGESRAVLITEYIGPMSASHIVWWALFRDLQEIVYVQNQIFWYERVRGVFEIEKASKYLEDRRAVTDEGKRISEWQTDRMAIQQCISSWPPEA